MNLKPAIGAGKNGEGGIRTLDRVAPIQHFQCCAFDHSATSPKALADANVAGHSRRPNMRPTHRITIHWRQGGRTISHEVAEGDYILRSFEEQGDPLPFSCRNGCCTACAVRVLSGKIDQHEAMGLSKELIAKGYGLLCVAKAIGPLEAETQDEDEVYELQFGRAFERRRFLPGIPT